MRSTRGGKRIDRHYCLLYPWAADRQTRVDVRPNARLEDPAHGPKRDAARSADSPGDL
jgi:hypothetical protein